MGEITRSDTIVARFILVGLRGGVSSLPIPDLYHTVFALSVIPRTYRMKSAFPLAESDCQNSKNLTHILTNGGARTKRALARKEGQEQLA